MGEDVIDQSYGNLSGGAACRNFEAGLSAYLDGESRPEVPGHAGECRFCSVLLSDLQQLVTASAALPDEDPPARLWANIRVALESEGVFKAPAGFWERWLPSLEFLRRPAPVAVLGGLALLSLLLVTPSDVSDSGFGAFLPRMSSQVPGMTPKVQLARAGVEVDGNLQQTVQELQAIYRSRALSFRPAVSAAYEQGLRSLDLSIEECQDSVRREPANGLAREYLLSAYEQKAEVLQSALEFEGR
jgi:hypothetical protein